MWLYESICVSHGETKYIGQPERYIYMSTLMKFQNLKPNQKTIVFKFGGTALSLTCD